jgi:hypothetical protein
MSHKFSLDWRNLISSAEYQWNACQVFTNTAADGLRSAQFQAADPDNVYAIMEILAHESGTCIISATTNNSKWYGGLSSTTGATTYTNSRVELNFCDHGSNPVKEQVTTQFRWNRESQPLIWPANTLLAWYESKLAMGASTLKVRLRGLRLPATLFASPPTVAIEPVASTTTALA